MLWNSQVPGLPQPRKGKVRDIYDLGSELLIVATDRLSAYDHILQPGIPGKGKILTQLSNFWFDQLEDLVPHHLIETDSSLFPAPLAAQGELLKGRSILVRKAEVIPFECVARGFLAGSGYQEYIRSESVCGVSLPSGLERASRLPEPIFTPATKAESGHDENIDFETLVRGVGEDLAQRLRQITLDLYRRGAERAARGGLLLADTKFEFGLVDGELILVDEALTSDSSRYWLADLWQPGQEPSSVDKQFVRNWLDASGWDRESPPPELPQEVVQGTLDRYQEAFRRLTGGEPEL
ncbi:MAG: phosphoribosylaminoimidazolesuccinocarboxamide synthase [Deltaproteobacteria bacterium]|nr:phosphoribosylaminoimidazolesuccinocarboxamide synthase [Deltaproteobacteria bacterium]